MHPKPKNLEEYEFDKFQLQYFRIYIPEEFDNDHWSHYFSGWIDCVVINDLNARETLNSK